MGHDPGRVPFFPEKLILRQVNSSDSREFLREVNFLRDSLFRRADSDLVFSVEAPEPDRAGRGRQRLVRRQLLVDESVQRLVRGLFVVASIYQTGRGEVFVSCLALCRQDAVVGQVPPCDAGEGGTPVRQGKYLVRMKITIPEGDAIGSNTWINLRLQGRTAYRKPAGAYLDTPKITPKAGQAYMIYNTITLDKRANYLQITANLFHFKPGTKVVISDLAVIVLSDEK